MTHKSEEPFPETPGERKARETEVVARLQEIPGLSDELRAALIDRSDDFLESETVRAPKSTHFYGYQIGWTKYAIRDDHLDMVAATGPVAVALAGYATATAPVSAVPIAIGLMFASLGVARKVRKKSAALSNDAYVVLMAVKRLGKASPKQIQMALTDIRLYPIGKWSTTNVEAILKQLQAVRLGDGSVEAFVVTDASGAWSTNGV